MGRIRVKHGPLSHIEAYPGLNGELIWAEDAGKLFITDIYGNKRLIGGDGNIIVQTIEQRNSIPQVMRQWRMIVGVYNDSNPFLNGQYELVYNLSDTNLSNNDNFRSLNKHVVHIENASGGMVPGGVHQLSTGVDPTIYVKMTGDRFEKVLANFQMDMVTGDVYWSTTNEIQDGYLVLI